MIASFINIEFDYFHPNHSTHIFFEQNTIDVQKSSSFLTNVKGIRKGYAEFGSLKHNQITMDQISFEHRLEALEQQLRELKNASSHEHNSDVVYETKTTFGYSQMVEVRGGKIIYLSGMTPWNKEFKLEENNLLDQLDHAFVNLIDLLKSKGLTLDNVVSLRFYVAKPNYYDEMENIAALARQHFGKKEVPCAMTLIGVTGLAEPDQLVELETIAVY